MIVVSIIYIFISSLLLLCYKARSLRTAEAEGAAIERIAAFIANGKGDVAAIGRGIARYNLMQCIVFVAQMTTVEERAWLRVIVRYYHIESYILGRLQSERNEDERAYLLLMLARLPMGAMTVARVEELVGCSSRRVSLSALIVLFAVTPYRAMSLLAKLPYRLSRRDIAEILSIISRGYSPIPYTPLLLSKNYNLRLLGIHLVRRFGIAESRSEIAVIIKERDSELRDDALSALASFGEEWSECERCKYHII